MTSEKRSASGGYGWSPEVQRKGVAFCLRQPQAYGRFGAEVFNARWVSHAPLRPLAETLYRACAENGGEPPSPELFAELGEDAAARRKPEEAAAVRRELALVLSADLSDRKLVESWLVEWARSEACAQAAIRAAELVERGAAKNGHGAELVKLFQDALAVGRASDSAASLVFEGTTMARELSVEEPRVPTGFPALDAALGGGAEQGLHMVAGKPKVGKTSFLTQISFGGCRARELVWHISGEVTLRPMLRRALSSGTGWTRAQVRRDPVKAARLLQGAYSQTGGDVLMEYAPRFTVPWMGARVRQLEAKGHRVGLIVADFLDLMGGREQAERRFELLEIGTDLRNLAIEIGVPIWTAKALSRRGDLAECFGLEYVVDNLFQLEEEPPPEGAERSRNVKLWYRSGRECEDQKLVGVWERDNDRQRWRQLRRRAGEDRQ